MLNKKIAKISEFLIGLSVFAAPSAIGAQIPFSPANQRKNRPRIPDIIPMMQTTQQTINQPIRSIPLLKI